MKLPPPPSEHDEQVLFLQLVAHHVGQYPELWMLFAIPNGGLRHIVVARRLKAEGAKPGVPDVFLPHPVGDYHGCFIEMKRQRVKGHQWKGLSDAQKEWMIALSDQGYYVTMCQGAQAALDTLLHYVRGEL